MPHSEMNHMAQKGRSLTLSRSEITSPASMCPSMDVARQSFFWYESDKDFKRHVFAALNSNDHPERERVSVSGTLPRPAIKVLMEFQGKLLLIEKETLCL